MQQDLTAATKVWIVGVFPPVVMLPGGLLVCVVVGSGVDPVPCSSLRAPPPEALGSVPWLSLLVLPGVPAVVESGPAEAAVASVPVAAAAVLVPAKSTTRSQNLT